MKLETKYFISVVVAGENLGSDDYSWAKRLSQLLESSVTHYELIVVDNASSDGSLALLREYLDSGVVNNTLLFHLSRKVEIDAAIWLGVENAVGDLVIVIPANEDGLEALPLLLDISKSGTDLVIAANEFPPSGTWPFKFARSLFGRLARRGTASLSRCMALSGRLVSFLQNHSQPQATFRQLTQVPGLEPDYVSYRAAPIAPQKKALREKYASGIQYLLWRNPSLLRGASLLALTGAVLNLIYALYVFGFFVFSKSVEPGWASSSLQFSGMFFLFSLVLFILSENVLLAVTISGRDPVAFISDEYTSRTLGHLDAINVHSPSPTEAPRDSRANEAK